jgi:hypothetical protein
VGENTESTDGNGLGRLPLGTGGIDSNELNVSAPEVSVWTLSGAAVTAA